MAINMQLIPNEQNDENSITQCRLPMHQVSAQLPAGNDHYTLQEKPFGHLIIRVDSQNNANMQKALKEVCKLELPSVLQSNENDSYIISWISPDEVLLLVPEKTEFEVESKLRECMSKKAETAEHFAIVNITGGQTLLELSGERAESILKKSTSYNIHLNIFPVGKVVTTIFAKSQTVLRRTSDDSFQLIVRRSFSDYLWKWIVDAGSRE